VTLNGSNPVNVAVGAAETDQIRSIENVIGGLKDDKLTGDGLANRLEGGYGSDTLAGGGGNDVLVGNVRPVYATVLSDIIDGGIGFDTVDYSGAAGKVTAALNGSAQVTIGVAGVAADKVRNVENVTGGSAADDLTGDAFANKLDGRAGYDILRAGAGKDVLIGGGGADDLYAGADNVRDTFVFTTKFDSGTSAARWDQLYNFDRSLSLSDATSDRIDLTALHVSGAVTFAKDGANMDVRVDVNGDGALDMVIQVMNVDALSARDILL
jgi:Ca2+-binding RTX toxin-like protein